MDNTDARDHGQEKGRARGHRPGKRQRRGRCAARRKATGRGAHGQEKGRAREDTAQANDENAGAARRAREAQEEDKGVNAVGRIPSPREEGAARMCVYAAVWQRPTLPGAVELVNTVEVWPLSMHQECGGSAERVLGRFPPAFFYFFYTWCAIAPWAPSMWLSKTKKEPDSSCTWSDPATTLVSGVCVVCSL